MNANRAAGNIANAHQMVLVVLRGSLFLIYIPKMTHVCTADVFVL